MEKDISGQLLSLLDVSDVLIAIYDENDVLVYFNEAFRREFGLERGERLSWADLMRRGHKSNHGCNAHARAADFEQWLAAARSRRGKVRFKSFETDMRSGNWVLMTETVNADGWMISIAPDITKLQKTDVQLVRMDRDIAERLALIDELTGVFNRRGITKVLDDLTSQNIDYTISMLDIDLFKLINDRHGHDCGDQVIKHFSSTVIKEIRGSDYLGRYGGEEFLLIFPRTTPPEACEIIDRIRNSIEYISCNGNKINYNFSAGVVASKDMDCPETSLKLADDALYFVKNNGRGATCVHMHPAALTPWRGGNPPETPSFLRMWARDS